VQIVGNKLLTGSPENAFVNRLRVGVGSFH